MSSTMSGPSSLQLRKLSQCTQSTDHMAQQNHIVPMNSTDHTKSPPKTDGEGLPWRSQRPVVRDASGYTEDKVGPSPYNPNHSQPAGSEK